MYREKMGYKDSNWIGVVPHSTKINREVPLCVVLVFST